MRHRRCKPKWSVCYMPCSTSRCPSLPAISLPFLLNCYLVERNNTLRQEESKRVVHCQTTIFKWMILDDHGTRNRTATNHSFERTREYKHILIIVKWNYFIVLEFLARPRKSQVSSINPCTRSSRPTSFFHSLAVLLKRKNSLESPVTYALNNLTMLSVRSLSFVSLPR